MSKHTPGPWRVIEPQEDKLRPYGVQMGKDGRFMVICYTVEQSKHNANLIAAAPEMLEALKETVYMRGIPDDEEDRSPYEKRLMAVLAKAKGETG